MLRSISGEFVVYRGPRALPNDLAETWPTERRVRFLIRTDVDLPISLDRTVLPVAGADDVAVFDLVATVVPSPEAAEAVARWRGSERFEAIPQSPEWQCLGYDVCDESGTSGLMNCSYESGERCSESFARGISRHHLFERAEDANRFRELCDRRIAEHAPFVVVSIYARTADIKLLQPGGGAA